MREAKTKVLDGKEYSYTQLTITPSLKLFSRLTKTAGPAFAALSGASKDPTGALSLAAKALSETLGEDDIAQIAKAFAAQTTVDGKPLLPIFEIHFDNIKQLFSFLFFALESEYAGFFGASSEKLSAAFEAAKSQAATQERQG